MSRIVLATTLADAATITASHEVATMTAANLKTPRLSSAWRSTTLTGVNLVIDLGQAEAINLAALLGTNFTSAATIRVRAATSQANLTASPLYDSTTVSAFPHWRADYPDRPVLHFPSSLVTARWWRIDLDDGANPEAFLEAGRLYLSRAWQPSINLQKGWSLRWEDLSRVDFSLNGDPFVDERPRRRILSGSFDFLTRAAMLSGIGELQRLQGIGGDILAIVDPDGSTTMIDDVVYGLFTDTTPRVNAALGIWQTAFEVREIPSGRATTALFRATSSAISRVA